MDKTLQALLGVALVVAGAILLLFLRESELGWFRGQPLGIVLLAIGVIDLGEAAWKRRG